MQDYGHKTKLYLKFNLRILIEIRYELTRKQLFYILVMQSVKALNCILQKTLKKHQI